MRLKILATAAMMGCTAVAASAAPPLYSLAAPIAGPDGGWDYASVDSAGTLYVARRDTIMAVTLATGAVARFGSLAHGHEVVPIAGTDLLLATSGDDGTARVFDRSSKAELGRMQVGDDADGAVYDPAAHLAYVVLGKPGRVAVVDPVARRVVASITVAPGLEFPAVASARLYINNETKGEIEVVDLTTRKVAAPIAMPGCERPTGLAYDARTNRLISACANGKAVIVDPASRRVVAMLPIGTRPDAVILDARRRRAFIPCGGNGVLEVLALDGAGGIRVVQSLRTEPGARTGALNPLDGTLYLPTARLLPPATPGARPVPIAGTFHVLVVRPVA